MPTVLTLATAVKHCERHGCIVFTKEPKETLIADTISEMEKTISQLKLLVNILEKGKLEWQQLQSQENPNARTGSS